MTCHKLIRCIRKTFVTCHKFIRCSRKRIFTIQVTISENFSQNNPSTFRISKFAFYNGPFYNLNQTDSNHHTFLYPGIHFVGGDLPYPCFLPLPRGHLLPQRYVRLLILYEYTGYRRFWFPLLMNFLPCKVNVL